jgi:AraC-like DNA-binding protein
MSLLPTVFARSVQKVARAVGSRDKARRLLKDIGLEFDALNDPILRIPYADMMAFSDRAARMTKDSAFGLHVGERSEQREYGLVGYSVMTSATLGDALRALMRYLPIWTDAGKFNLDVESSVAFFQWDYARCSWPEPRHDCEMSMSTVASFNLLTEGTSWKPREVWFQHSKPSDCSEHARIFRAPVRFGMPMNAMLLDRRLLSRRMVNADPFSHQALTSAAEQMLAQSAGGRNFSQYVIDFVRQSLSSGKFDLEAASRHFGIGQRTMQRRLKQESSSHRQIVNTSRRELSRHLLLNTDATATDAAYALGFSEPSEFHRAFYKWYGMSPLAYRRAGNS